MAALLKLCNVKNYRCKDRIKFSCLWSLVCILGIKAYDDFCDDYLMSGWQSHNDSAYREIYGVFENNPNLRLYSTNMWTQEYHSVYQFQIHFPSPRKIKAMVTISPSTMTIYLYVCSMPLLCMLQVFVHNVAEQEPQYYFLDETPNNTTVLYIDITDTTDLSLQFDLIGCIVTEDDVFEAEDLQSFAFVPIAVENLPSGSVLGENVKTHMDCGMLCFDRMSCVAFSSNEWSGQCIGYETNVYGNFLQGERKLHSLRERQSYYFYNYGLTRMLDYRRDVSINLMYRVYTIRKTQWEAARYCAHFSADLLIISNLEQMASVRQMLNSSTVLSHEGPYYISGNYSSGTWKYNENATIPNTLWSTGPNIAHGYCVVLGQDGIRSIECDMELFFICAL